MEIAGIIADTLRQKSSENGASEDLSCLFPLLSKIWKCIQLTDSMLEQSRCNKAAQRIGDINYAGKLIIRRVNTFIMNPASCGPHGYWT